VRQAWRAARNEFFKQLPLLQSAVCCIEQIQVSDSTSLIHEMMEWESAGQQVTRVASLLGSRAEPTALTAQFNTDRPPKQNS
jgi:hypothetical protein